MNSLDFASLIKKDREERKQHQFSGTFLDYLKIVKENSRREGMLAHQRMYEQLVSQGIEIIKTEEHPRLKRIYGNATIKRYNFFKKDFFGIDNSIMKIMRFFHSAAMQGEEARQVLYLVGPVGAGKSSLMEAFKKALEMCPPIYVIKDCPMRETPLHLVPKHLRPQFEEILGLKIEGDLCPVCRYRLKTDYKGEFEKVPVAMSEFSVRSRKGVGVVPPVDPNNQDTSVLIGSVDISKLDMFPEDDPRDMSLNG